MDKRKLIEAIGVVLTIAIIFLIGLYVGKKITPVKTITKIEYVQAEPIHDSIPKPVPIYIKTPIDTANIIAQCVKDGIYQELFPEKYKTDTLYLEKEDTTKIIADWATIREYKETLFNSDTLGTMIINTSVQYNRLNEIYYTFTPINKVITNNVYIKRNYLPFIGIGASTFPSINGEIGLFIKQSWGLSINGNYYINKNQYEYIPKYDLGVKVLKMF